MRFLLNVSASRVQASILATAIGMFISAAVHAAPADFQADIAYLFDDNVTRGSSGWGQLSDQAISTTLGRAATFPISEHTRASLKGTLGVEKFMRHDGLSHISAGLQSELQYRSSAEFGTPVFALSGNIAVDQYQSDQRDGFRYALGVSVRNIPTDRIRLFAAATHNGRRGNNTVFDNKDDGVRFNLDYDLNRAGTLYFGAEYRRGDIVVTGPWWNTYGSDRVADDVFRDWTLYSYRLDGRTVLSTLGYNHALGARSSLDLSWRRAQSGSQYIVLPSWNTVSVDYTSNQYSFVYLMRF